MPTTNLFALCVLALGIGALALAIAYETARITAMSGRSALVRRKLQSRTEELKALTAQVADTGSRADLQQATLDRLVLERGRLTGLIASVKASKVALVHELGDPESSALLYECDLTTTPDFGRIEARRLLFAREIWGCRNVVHVWADTPDEAMAAVQRAFNTRSGLMAGRVQRVVSAAVAGARDEAAE